MLTTVLSSDFFRKCVSYRKGNHGIHVSWMKERRGRFFYKSHKMMEAISEVVASWNFQLYMRILASQKCLIQPWKSTDILYKTVKNDPNLEMAWIHPWSSVNLMPYYFSGDLQNTWRKLPIQDTGFQTRMTFSYPSPKTAGLCLSIYYI